MDAITTLQAARKYVQTCDPPADLLRRYDEAIVALGDALQSLTDLERRYPNNVGMVAARAALAKARAALAKARGG